jgi:hypothetical protein
MSQAAKVTTAVRRAPPVQSSAENVAAAKSLFDQIAATNLAVVFEDAAAERLQSTMRAWEGLACLVASCCHMPDGDEMYALMRLIIDEQAKAMALGVTKKTVR